MKHYHKLALAAGLIHETPADREEHCDEELVDWVNTSHDKCSVMWPSPEVLERDAERKQEEFTERTVAAIRNANRARTFWRDYEIVLYKEDDTIDIIPRDHVVTYRDKDTGEIISQEDHNEAGFFRWTEDGEKKSSFDFIRDPIRTKRQIAGFILGKVGRDKSIAIVKVGAMRRGKVETPVYQAFISEQIPATFLTEENIWASSLRVVDTARLERPARLIKTTERNARKAEEKADNLSETSFDEELVRKWEAIALALEERVLQRRKEYSELIGKVYSQAKQVEEPQPHAVTEGIDCVPIEFMTTPEEEMEQAIDDEFLDDDDSQLNARLENEYSAKQWKWGTGSDHAETRARLNIPEKNRPEWF